MTSPKSAVKEKMKYSNTSGAASIGSASSENGKPISPYSIFDDFEQLPPVGGGVHGNKYVGQAVYGFHVAACCYPYHFCEWLRDCSGYKVYLILADFAGRGV